jgi:hypothetical protein
MSRTTKDEESRLADEAAAFVAGFNPDERAVVMLNLMAQFFASLTRIESDASDYVSQKL